MNKQEMREFLVTKLRERKKNPYADISSVQIECMLDLLDHIVNGEENASPEFVANRYVLLDVLGEPTEYSSDNVEELISVSSPAIGMSIWDSTMNETVKFYDGDSWT